MIDPHVIGMDFGTDSVRALLVNALTGGEVDSTVFNYPRWGGGMYCDAQKTQFRQHPLDYIEGVESVIGTLTKRHPEIAGHVRAICVDTTASTPCLVDAECRPLALRPEYAENPNAMFVLWKDHTGEKEAAEITALCSAGPVNYARQSGSHYSAENFWSKITHIFREEPALKKDARSAIELCDFIPALLAGISDINELKRSRCTMAGKWLWSEKWNGYPPSAFFARLDPSLPEFVSRLGEKNYTCDHAAGALSPEWAARLALPEGIKIGVGNVDSHSGAVGAGVVDKMLVLNLGTSACCMTVVPPAVLGDRFVEGVHGQAHSLIIPGLVGIETGLSAFGDVYAWFRDLLAYPLTEILAKSKLLDADTAQKLIAEIRANILRELDAAAATTPGENAPFATDWLNGRRSPAPDAALSGGITGLRLSSTAPQLYRALVEATAFATRAIVDHLAANNLEIDHLVAAGGISQKSPFVMQTLSDVLGREIRVTGCPHTCALGAAVFASVVAGVHGSVAAAQKILCKPAVTVYRPDMLKHRGHLRGYERYKTADAFTRTLAKN
ncbi:L-ribulokinase [Ereboglobus sp. PH5-5]|uniref:ribulokinase n=1 Tax=unclassified Ereboglobus TaxID=2626932 RepID=UPI0024070C7E|nr:MULTISPECIES: ribulokinase [unclassified Ereboglobus]MDF9827855.1 L-ribulokinase [Ereboglobus sp. PH5-10]MDF9833526.1 L-ribulokinase [Ereboglobus sp. PH5-5]